jgi:flagellar biosynthesis protein FliP
MANLGNVTSGWLQMKMPLIPALGLAFLAGVLLASPALAQEVTLNLGDDGSVAARSIQLIVLITLLSLVPGLAIMITCFPFIVTVLAILRQAIGLQQSPPNMLIVTLALFLTYFVMEPVFLAAWAEGIEPLINDGIPVEQAFMQTLGPFREFMSGRIDVDTFEALAALRPDLAQSTPVADAPLSVLVPSFSIVRNRPRLSDRFHYLSAISDHRPRCGGDPDVDGYDDGATGYRFTTLQTRLLCRRRRMEPDRQQPRPQLPVTSNTSAVGRGFVESSCRNSKALEMSS